MSPNDFLTKGGKEPELDKPSGKDSGICGLEDSPSDGIIYPNDIQMVKYFQSGNTANSLYTHTVCYFLPINIKV